MAEKRSHENGMPMNALNWAHVIRPVSGYITEARSARSPPIKEPPAQPIAKRLVSAAELLLSKPKVEIHKASEMENGTSSIGR